MLKFYQTLPFFSLTIHLDEQIEFNQDEVKVKNKRLIQKLDSLFVIKSNLIIYLYIYVLTFLINITCLQSYTLWVNKIQNYLIVTNVNS